MAFSHFHDTKIGDSLTPATVRYTITSKDNESPLARGKQAWEEVVVVEVLVPPGAPPVKLSPAEASRIALEITLSANYGKAPFEDSEVLPGLPAMAPLEYPAGNSLPTNAGVL